MTESSNESVHVGYTCSFPLKSKTFWVGKSENGFSVLLNKEPSTGDFESGQEALTGARDLIDVCELVVPPTDITTHRVERRVTVTRKIENV